ncbi:hypothetical protein [Halegenticoccus soli]|uniref:hypothetical protein n=1 Tax=Halegenticoccus soli TaxID=1985678 RepID=UPI000C6ECF7C|nr:hypothetical protein [Halegenticoccus soli]
MALRNLLADGGTNAAVAWAILAFLFAVAVAEAALGSFLWAGFAVVAALVAAVPPLAARDPSVMLPWWLLAVVAIPPVVEPFEPLTKVAAYFAVAALALSVAVDLHAFTAARMSRRFAVAFVVLTTMAVAGVWTTVRGLADLYFGASFFRGPNDLMWDLVVSSAVGVLGGLGFERYFYRADHGGVRGLSPRGDGE